jgi:hypothetical protein
MKNIAKISVLFSALALGACTSTASFDPSTGMNQSEVRVLGGIASVRSSTYDRQRGLDQTAQVMIASDDIGLQATGQAILESSNGNVARIGDTVREVITEETTSQVSCQVTGVQATNGGRQVNLGNCVPS